MLMVQKYLCLYFCDQYQKIYLIHGFGDEIWEEDNGVISISDFKRKVILGSHGGVGRLKSKTNW